MWEIIEGIYQESNPTYIRRVKVYEMKMEKGELCGDFVTRLKLEYQESEMEKATVWSHFVCKIISSLSSAGSDNRDLKSKLIEAYRENPDPDEKGLEIFQKVIREHESMIRAREFKEETAPHIRVVRQEDEPNVGSRPHRLCGKVHGRNECKVQCPCCKKMGSHRKEDCYELYPDKRPKSWNTPTKKKGKGRGTERERSRSKSVEKGEKSKERREPSPYPGRTNRVTTEY